LHTGRRCRGGATLINDRWAVTAASFVEKAEESSLVLYGGLTDGRTTNNPHVSNVTVMESERIIIHPGYSRDTGHAERTNFDNDIALIRFSSRVNFGPNLLPICLPEVNRGMVENEQGTVSGWGMTESTVNPKKLVTSRVLKHAQIGVYPLEQCEITPNLETTGKRMVFTNNMFCAGAPGRDSCQKDSGGPFVTPLLSLNGGPYYLTGIVSWGPPCDQRMYKGYYTKVENYVDWIKETINKIETF
uniref:trypsin n=1 Tax=Anabas testudineus TaxID=64144 RepID=A0A3Q1KAM0_ANATE